MAAIRPVAPAFRHRIIASADLWLSDNDLSFFPVPLSRHAAETTADRQRLVGCSFLHHDDDMRR